MDDRAEMRSFLKQNLPAPIRNNTDAIVRALDEAERRYERYAATRGQWENYRARRRSLQGIAGMAKVLHSRLTDLDAISKDELELTFGEEEIEKLQGHLGRLAAKTNDLVKFVQSTGRPRDLATRIWLLEVADIYEKNFGRKPAIHGSATGERSARGKFFRFLELSQPASFPRHEGALHPKKLIAILKTRQKKAAWLDPREASASPRVPLACSEQPSARAERKPPPGAIPL
jgi:hypothetical protein